MGNFGAEDNDFVKRAGKFGCCARWQRRILVLGNLFLFCMAAVFIAVPALLIYKPDCPAKMTCPDMNLPGLELLGPEGKALLIVFMAAGVILLLIAFLGCCGSIRKSRCMLLTYACLLFAMLMMEMATVGYAFKKITDEDQLKKLFCKHWNQPNYQKSKLKLEKAIGCRCCASDQNVLASYTPVGYCPAGGTGKIINDGPRPKPDPKFPGAGSQATDMDIATATVSSDGVIDESTVTVIHYDDVKQLTCGDIDSHFCGTGAAIDGVDRTGSAGACSLACEDWALEGYFPSMCGPGGTVGEFCELKVPENDPGYMCKWEEAGSVPSCSVGTSITFLVGDPSTIEGMDDAPPACPSNAVTCYYNWGDKCVGEGAIDGYCGMTACYAQIGQYLTKAECETAEAANFQDGYDYMDPDDNAGVATGANATTGNDAMDDWGYYDGAYRRRLPALDSLKGSPDYSALKEVLHRRRLAGKKHSKDASAPVKSLWCYDVVKNKIKKNFKIIAGVGFVTVCYQIFGTIFACVVARAIKKSRKEKDSAAQIAQNVGQRR